MWFTIRHFRRISLLRCSPISFPTALLPYRCMRTPPASCVRTNTPSCIQENTTPTVIEKWSYSFSPFTSTSCVQEDTPSPAIGTSPHRLNPFAPSFDRPRGEPDRRETEQITDELPDHINLLYQTTIAKTRLTADVDRQFRDVLRRRATTFATDSTDIGFCPVLQHDIDTGDAPPIKQSPRRPPLSAGNAENDILDDMLLTE